MSTEINLDFEMRLARERKAQKNEEAYQAWKEERLAEEKRHEEMQEKINAIGKRMHERQLQREAAEREAELEKMRVNAEEEYYKQHPERDERLMNSYREIAHNLFDNL